MLFGCALTLLPVVTHLGEHLRRGDQRRDDGRAEAGELEARAAIDLAADGFTVETLADQVRNRPREEHDDREPWASYTNPALAIAFWKERGLLDIRRRRNHVDDGFLFEDAMIEFHVMGALTSEPAALEGATGQARRD